MALLYKSLLLLGILSVNLLRSFLYLFIIPLSFINSNVRNRLQIEKSALRVSGHYKDVFEVSSEGELQMVLPLIMKRLKTHNVLLLFCSPSVEKQCLSLSSTYNNLTSAALPLLRYSLIPWPGAISIFSKIKYENIYFCRYDFFPELLFECFFQNAVCLGASLKNKKTNIRSYTIYSLFNFILAVNKQQEKNFKTLLPLQSNVESGDFRHIHINDRISHSAKIISDHGLDSLVDKIEQFPGKKLILGSCWPIDLNILNNEQLLNEIKNNKLIIVLAPHLLSNSSLAQFEKQLKEYGLNPYSGPGADYTHNMSNIILLHDKGVLAELYRYFDLSYIGGGFGRSVHSLLEPFWAGCHILCGEKVHRSTEYDVILDIDHTRVLMTNSFDEISNNILNNDYKNCLPDVNLEELNSGIKLLEDFLC